MNDAGSAYGLWSLVVINSAMFPLLAFAYLRLARREEREAAAQFGDEWARYASRTPAFLPRWTGRRASPG